MTKEPGIVLNANWSFVFKGFDYKLDIDRLSMQSMDILNLLNGFCCLPLPCKKNGLFSNAAVTLFLYNDKRAFNAYKKSPQGKSHREIIKNAVFVDTDISELRVHIISQVKDILKDTSATDFVNFCETVGYVTLTLEIKGGYVLTIDNGKASSEFYFFDIEGCRDFWNIQHIKYPVGDVSSNEYEEKEIACMMDGGIFTDASEEQFFEFMSACLIGYQQVHGKLYEETGFVTACRMLYNKYGLPSGNVLALYQTIYEMQYHIRGLFEEGQGKTTVPVVNTYALQQARAERKREAGEAGESTVEYVLKWLQGSGFQSIGNRIRLKNPAFINESQEYNHLLVCPGGIVCIETQNLGGKITVTESGQWIQEKAGVRKGLESPVFQVDRHHALLASILGDIPLYDVICIANQGCEIIGAEHSPVPVVKYDMLQRYLTQLPDTVHLSIGQMQEVIQTIKQYKV